MALMNRTKRNETDRDPAGAAAPPEGPGGVETRTVPVTDDGRPVPATTSGASAAPGTEPGGTALREGEPADVRPAGADARPARTVTSERPVTTAAPEAVGVPRVRVTRMVGVAAVLFFAGAWAGIVPFIGPAFGFSADHTPSWTWNLAHAILNLAPGVAAMVAALWMWAAVPEVAYDRRRPLTMAAGVLAILAGAWLVIGPFTWPVLYGHTYWSAGAWGLMLRQIGYSLGPGLIIVAAGAYGLGWSGHTGASRRLRDHVVTTAGTEPREVPAA